jgi:pyruvate dehydrogenase E1 component alpha subunit
MGKVTGICKGLGGSMHLTDTSVGIVGESAIVGGGIPIAAGCGLSAKVRRTDQVALCFFGDGAVNQGTFHESLNMASLWKLPVVFLCENNGYALTTSIASSHAQPDIARRADAYGMPGVKVDGQDVAAVFEATRDAVDNARRGNGPTLIEAQTYRFDDHAVALSVGTKHAYRPAEEVEHYKTQRDPIALFEAAIAGTVDQAALEEIQAEVADAVASAIRFAEESAFPTAEVLPHYMFASAPGGRRSSVPE